MSKISITVWADGNISASSVVKHFIELIEEIPLGLREGTLQQWEIDNASGEMKVEREVES
jgi:hypothetical protein